MTLNNALPQEASSGLAGSPSDQSVMLDLAAGRPNLLITFGGINGGMGGAAFEFGAVTKSLDVDRVFVRDQKQAWYQFGLEGVSHNIAESVAALHSICSPAKYQRVVAIGNSMGGYAAILFGCLLGVDEIHAFSPQTYIDPMHRLITRDFRWRKQLAPVHRKARPQKSMWDLRAVLAAKRATTRCHIHYCSTHRLDRTHAIHVQASRGAILHAYPFGGHSLVRELRDAGLLTSLIDSSLT